jgi:hypothetical protein
MKLVLEDGIDYPIASVLTSVWLASSLTTPGICPSLRTLDLSGLFV